MNENEEIKKMPKQWQMELNGEKKLVFNEEQN